MSNNKIQNKMGWKCDRKTVDLLTIHPFLLLIFCWIYDYLSDASIEITLSLSVSIWMNELKICVFSFELIVYVPRFILHCLVQFHENTQAQARSLFHSILWFLSQNKKSAVSLFSHNYIYNSLNHHILWAVHRQHWYMVLSFLYT